MGETVLHSDSLSTSLRSGEVIGGKYRLEREIGKGAMGTVWLAQHLTLGQRVAIKLIAAEHAQSPEARVRFSIEAKAAARLKSRYVVQVYDDGETPEGTPYIVMEFLEGETLEARLEREREIPLPDAVRVAAQVGRALARAHAQNIVHRDLKPANIFLSRNDEDDLGWTTKVLDFGIAKVDEGATLSTTKTGAVLGTPLFMSPEQVRGANRVDFRSDLYSLGICVYNMLTGQFAFDGESFGDILVSICTEPLPDLKAAAPTVPDAVAEWFKRCCAREPENRFQSADELVEALQRAVGGGTMLMQRGTVPEDFRGPSGTIRGHSAPLGPTTTALDGDDSGRFLAALAAPGPSGVKISDKFKRSDSAASVLTVHDVAASPKARSRRVVYSAAGAVGAIVLILLSLAWSKPDSAKTAAAGRPPSEAGSKREPAAAPALAPAPAPTPVAAAPAAAAAEPAKSSPTTPDSAGAAAAEKPRAPRAALKASRTVAKPSAKSTTKPAPATAPRKSSKSPTDLGF